MTIRFRAFSDIDKMVNIRLLTSEDIPFVAEIEQLCFSEPWSENALQLLLQGKNAGFVAEIDGFVAAYGGMLTVLDEGQITNVAVDPMYRRKGFGREIVCALIEYAEKNGIVSISLEVRESNEAAIALYESFGFCRRGLRKNFYREPTETAIVMVWDKERT